MLTMYEIVSLKMQEHIARGLALQLTYQLQPSSKETVEAINSYVKGLTEMAKLINDVMDDVGQGRETPTS